MSYITRFALKAEYHEAATPQAAIQSFTQTNEEAAYCLASDGSPNESGRWYDHEAHILAFSKLNPHLLFVLNGWGEEAGDIWVKYFHNGKVQEEKASLQLGGFDPAKLK